MPIDLSFLPVQKKKEEKIDLSFLPVQKKEESIDFSFLPVQKTLVKKEVQAEKSHYDIEGYTYRGKGESDAEGKIKEFADLPDPSRSQKIVTWLLTTHYPPHEAAVWYLGGIGATALGIKIASPFVTALAKNVPHLLKQPMVQKALAKVIPATKKYIKPTLKLIAKTPRPTLKLFTKTPKVISKSQIPMSVQKIISALKKAKPTRKLQETIYSKERGARLAKSLATGAKVKGEKGFYAELSKLKGDLPKVQFESIRSKFTQTDIDDLFIMIKDSQSLNDWQKIPARQGLAKLFGEYGGSVPTEGEIGLLNKIFGKDFTKTVLQKRPLLAKLKNAGYEIANIPRSIMSSFDLSAPFRQGVFFVGRFKQFFPAFKKMFKAFGSEKSFMEIQNEITRRPTHKLMTESRLALTQMGKFLDLREEQFMSSWAEKIPVIGRGVRASGRAYVGFLNKLRADVFDDLIKKAGNLGLNPKSNLDLTKAIANFVNVGTGRGSLGGLNKASVALNTFFFSPRLMASRLSLLNPAYYIKQPPFVRKEALKSLFSFASLGLTTLGLAKLSGAEVGIDPRNSDFGKIKIGNTRVDPWGGFQQYIRMAAQLISGKYVSSVTGKTVTLGEGYKPLTRYDIVLRQIESKESPVFSFVTTLLRQQTYMGEKVSVPKEVGKRFIPMAMSDVYEIGADDPSLLPVSALGMFGVGVQTYKERPSRRRILEISKR